MAVLFKWATVALAAIAPLTYAQRPMENLGRGVVAVRSSDEEVLVSWRLLGLDNHAGIGFNVYRASDGGEPVKLNGDEPTMGGTNWIDGDADAAVDNVYHVTPVVDGQEGEASGSFTLPADNPVEPIVRIPIGGSGTIRYVWAGDLDGDGEYDFVVDRTTETQAVEAYHRNGTLLWAVDLGPNSANMDNIEPGSTAIDVGNWDGVTVYDFDSDGKAEVAIRIANGVTFGDGTTFEHDDDSVQFMALLSGETGALLSSSQIPDDYISDGPLAGRFGVGYLDGVTPHLVAFFKNRQENEGPFNAMFTAWTYDGSDLQMAWKWLREDGGLSDGHNTRIIDADRDGVDEVHEIGFTLNGDGSLKYSLGDHGVGHGDRFHIARMDPDSSDSDGLQGFGCQQDNPDFLLEYYYDAGTGDMIWQHYGDAIADVGRAMAGDIDPNYPGMEVWSFSGLFNAPTDEQTSAEHPWPQIGIFWDGDELMDLFNDGKFEKWDPEAQDVSRIFKLDDYGAVKSDGPDASFYGDILGDWREEVIALNADHTELLIFTTDHPTDIRLYTLAHNPAYRNSMTLKGYVQSNHVDYFIGRDMTAPPVPDIFYAGT